MLEPLRTSRDVSTRLLADPVARINDDPASIKISQSSSFALHDFFFSRLITRQFRLLCRDWCLLCNYIFIAGLTPVPFFLEARRSHLHLRKLSPPSKKESRGSTRGATQSPLATSFPFQTGQSHIYPTMSNQRQASSASQVPHLSPAELSYLYTSLSLPKTPIRPDGRSPTQFRPLTAEANILPGTNGSARIGFADGTQAIVGVKAEVEKTILSNETLARNDGGVGGEQEGSAAVGGHGSWVQMSIEIPGFRDDDALPVFLSEMMRESLVGAVGTDETSDMTGGLKGRLVINKRWHWRLYIDVRPRIPFDSRSVLSVVDANHGITGPPSLATSRISPPSSLANHTSRSSFYETSQAQVSRRGGSFLRR